VLGCCAAIHAAGGQGADAPRSARYPPGPACIRKSRTQLCRLAASRARMEFGGTRGMSAGNRPPPNAYFFLACGAARHGDGSDHSSGDARHKQAATIYLVQMCVLACSIRGRGQGVALARHMPVPDVCSSRPHQLNQTRTNSRADHSQVAQTRHRAEVARCKASMW
jgi:hypothetical protein